MKAAYRHFLIRLRVVLGSPITLLALALTAMAGIVYWPVHVIPVAIEERGSGLLVGLFMIWLLPAIATRLVAGHPSFGRAGAGPVGSCPALPVSSLRRATADALLTIAAIVVIRLPLGLVLRQVPWLMAVPGVGATVSGTAYPWYILIGAFILLPMAIAWASPAGSIEGYWWRPFAILLVYGAAAGLNLTHTTAGTLVAGLAGLLIALALHHKEPRPDRLVMAIMPMGKTRQRRARPPVTQLGRDFLLKPLPILCIPLVLAAWHLVMRRLLPDVRPFPDFISGLAVGLTFALLCFRPMNSNVLMNSMTGKSGGRFGEFADAWSVLPVKPVHIARGVYLHGLLSGTFLWLLVTVIHLLNHSEPLTAFTLLGGDLFRLLGLAPCLGGFLTAAAFGDKHLTTLSMIAMLLLFNSILPFFDSVPMPVFGAVYGAILLAGAVPPLRYLRDQTVTA